MAMYLTMPHLADPCYTACRPSGSQAVCSSCVTDLDRSVELLTICDDWAVEPAWIESNGSV